MMKNLSDIRELVEKAKEGDLSALSGLYDEYYDRIYRYILLRVKCRADAEDLTGQTFLRMLEGIGKFVWRDLPFSAWLFRIAHNQVVDRWRRAKEVPVEIGAAAPEADDPAILAVLDESVREAFRALDQLNEDQRQVLLLRLIGGLSCRETAAALGLSAGNVRIIQYRALAKIREIMLVKMDV